MQLSQATSASNPRVYFDLEIGGQKAGRVIMELFKNVCPRSAENFRQLCTGESGKRSSNGKNFTFKNSVFHRVISGFMMQGGDFTHSNGTGGESIYGRTFPDENFKLKHETRGLLSMANAGKNTNGSQFFLTFTATPHLNGKHVVFGRVEKGYDVCQRVEKLKCNAQDKPNDKVVIAECGEIKPEAKKEEKKREEVKAKSTTVEVKSSEKKVPEEKKREDKEPKKRSRSRSREIQRGQRRESNNEERIKEKDIKHHTDSAKEEGVKRRESDADRKRSRSRE
uniref:Peptidyl-prolyl cis-trans isomerase n=1 Tax=Stylonychia lemnae TaxID=5949 RepID=A7RA46_STYLE|nr:cyclophilin [Stylonychia lemnae]